MNISCCCHEEKLRLQYREGVAVIRIFQPYYVAWGLQRHSPRGWAPLSHNMRDPRSHPSQQPVGDGPLPQNSRSAPIITSFRLISASSHGRSYQSPATPGSAEGFLAHCDRLLFGHTARATRSTNGLGIFFLHPPPVPPPPDASPRARLMPLKVSRQPAVFSPLCRLTGAETLTRPPPPLAATS